MATEWNGDISGEWRHGLCYPMACALSDRLGWAVGALVVDMPPALRGDPARPHVVHAWAVSPDGRARSRRPNAQWWPVGCTDAPGWQHAPV
jgi:hypothetical protein